MSHNDRTHVNEHGEFEVLISSSPAEAPGIADVGSGRCAPTPVGTDEEFEVLICSYPSEPASGFNSVEGDTNDER
ncbi:hypothetical protein HNQ75_004422 [Rhizobium flavum]|uniref:Uncharacterized protein n=1 Tax=Pseudorhizobium flavum TaxID=1335061 RepID=A0A7X0DEW6_9HYPH|nr:hypothetical protein [Pseudorhizobium flavum]CAD6599147.1 hypothetical protein RFYW14_00647 [Pseudorhizobium flavum]